MNMKYFENIDLSNVVIVRMKSMEDTRTKILGVMAENKFKRAVILSAIGSVYDAIFCGVKQKSELPYNQDQITIMKKKGPFEVLTMEGNILPLEGQLIPHIHVTLGTHDGNVIGGHLETATVYTTIELLLAEIKKSISLGHQRHHLDELLVRTVMKTPVIWTSPNITASDAAALMLKKNIGALPIVENDKIIGIVSRTDLLNTIPR